MLLLLTVASARAAGPVDFGKAELDAALAERKLKLHVDTELSLDPPETFSITLYKTGMVRVTGGDLRGLMYGLIEAAEQIRATGRLKAASGKPATAVRGVRMALRSYDLTQPWFTSDDRWRAYFQTLARSRLNRFSLVLPLAEADIERLRILSETAAEYGVDFVLGIRHLTGDPQELYARLRGILDNCPLIRGVQIEAGDEPVQLYQEGVFRGSARIGTPRHAGFARRGRPAGSGACGSGIGSAAQSHPGSRWTPRVRISWAITARSTGRTAGPATTRRSRSPNSFSGNRSQRTRRRPRISK